MSHQIRGAGQAPREAWASKSCPLFKSARRRITLSAQGVWIVSEMLTPCGGLAPSLRVAVRGEQVGGTRAKRENRFLMPGAKSSAADKQHVPALEPPDSRLTPPTEFAVDETTSFRAEKQPAGQEVNQTPH